MNLARLLYIGVAKLGFTEDEVFRMTPRKFYRLFDEYQELNGFKKKPATIDDLP